MYTMYIYANNKKYNECYTQPKMGLYVTSNLFYTEWSENSKKRELTIQHTFPGLLYLINVIYQQLIFLSFNYIIKLFIYTHFINFKKFVKVWKIFQSNI